MTMLSSLNVKLKHLRRGTLRHRSRRPVLEPLEGRALLSASHAPLHDGFQSQVAMLVHNADHSLVRLPIGTGGESVQVYLRHAVA